MSILYRGGTKLNTLSQLIIAIHVHLSSECTHYISSLIITRERKMKRQSYSKPQL